MRVRFRQFGRRWRTVSVSVAAGIREGHKRAIVTVTKKDGISHTLELNQKDAYNLANHIVDAMEGGAA